MANDATVKFGYDGTALNRGLAQQETKLKGFASSTERSFRGVQAAIGGLGLGILAREGVRVVAAFDRMTRGMTTLEGSATGAKFRMDELREASKLPGLDFEQAVQGDIRLRSVGVSAELSKRALIEMGNALSLAGGTSADLDGVVLALTQIISKGKVSAEEINQIAERVPQVRAVMKDMFGTADTETLQKMNIDAETFVATLVEGFGRLDRAQAGLDEKMQDFTTSIKAATDAFAEGFVRQGVEGASKLGEALQENTDLIRDLGSATSGFFSGAASAAKTADDMIVSAIAHIGLMMDGQTLAQANAAITALDQERAAEKVEAAQEKSIQTTSKSAAVTALVQERAAAKVEAAQEKSIQTIRKSAAVAVEAEKEKQNAIQKTISLRDMETRRNEEMGSLKLLDLRSRGRNAAADKLERKMNINNETERIRSTTGASEAQARQMAEDRVRLQENIERRNSGQRSRIIARPRGDGGPFGQGFDEFLRAQEKREVGFNETPMPGYERGQRVPVYSRSLVTGDRSLSPPTRSLSGGGIDAFLARQSPTVINTSGARTQQTVNAARKDDLSAKIDRTNELLSRGLLGS
jgi:tape measure domain-containing protein